MANNADINADECFLYARYVCCVRSKRARVDFAVFGGFQ